MNKKSIKLFAVSALAFFASATLVNAKTYTSLDALTKDVETWRAKENEENGETKEDGFIYIIGKYVFTSNYDLKSWESYATAFQTIPTSSKSYIFQINRKYNDLEATGWDIEGKKNLFDNVAKLPENINIQYIDMELIDDAVDNDEAVKSIVDSANNAVKATENTSIYDKYSLVFDAETGTISVSIKDSTLTLASVKNSGIAAELNKLLTSGNYSEIKITDLATSGKSISLKANATTGDIKDSLVDLFTGKSTLENFVAQSYKVEFVLADGKVNNTTEERTNYTLSFVKIVNTDSLFVTTTEDAAKTADYVFSCKAIEGANCTPIINIVKAFTSNGQANQNENVSVTQYKGIEEYADTIVKMVGTNGVSSVNVTIGSTNYTYTSADMNEDLVKTDLESALIKLTGKSKANITLIDLLGTEITITVNLDGTKAKSQNGKLTETYKVDVIGETNSDEEVVESTNHIQDVASKNVSWGYSVEYDAASRTILFKLAQAAKLPMTSNSDLVDSLTDLYYSGLYETVTVKSTGAKDFVLGTCENCVNGSKGQIFTKYVAWLNELTNSKATEDRINFNLRTLIGKTITIELKPVSDGVVNTGHDSYTIKFVSDANTRTDLETALSKISGTATATVKTVDGKKTGDYTLDVTTSKLDAVLDDTQRGNLEESIKSTIASGLYKSITINVLGTNYEITYTAGDIPTYGKLTDLMTVLKNTKVSALRGSNITVTYVLADDVKNADDAELKYTLILTTVADTNSKVDTAVKANTETSFNIAFDEETRTLTFDLRKPYESVGNIVDAKTTKFADNIKTILATGLYKSLTFNLDGEEFAVTYDATKKELVGFDALINKIGRSTTLVQLAGKEVTMTFELADGVTDKVTTGNTVEYKVVLSNVVNSLDVIEEQILAKETSDTFTLIVDDNKNIQALYSNGSVKLSAALNGTGLLSAVQTSFEDERIESYTVKIGNKTILIDKNSDLDKVKQDIIIALVNSTKLFDTIAEGIETNVTLDKNNYNDHITKLANIDLNTLYTKIKETNTELSVSVNLVEGKAVNESNTTTAEYNIKLSLYSGVDVKVSKIKINSKELTIKDNKAVIDVITSGNSSNKANDVNFNIDGLISAINNSKFASVSFEIGTTNIIINKDEFATEIKTAKVAEITKAINALAGVTGDNNAKLGDLVGKEIKVTVNMAEDVVSRNGRTSETYTISFETKEA